MKNLHSTPESVLTIAEAVCDRCGSVMSADTADFRESLSINHHCGEGSVFGEGKLLRLDLCQTCMQEVLGPWLRAVEPIAPSQVERLTEFITLVQDSFSNDQAAIDEWLDTGCNDLGGESPHAYLERTGETEPIVRLLRNSDMGLVNYAAMRGKDSSDWRSRTAFR